MIGATWDPHCTHAQPRPKNRLVVVWYHCDVRCRELYKPDDCTDCPSHRAPDNTPMEEMTMDEQPEEMTRKRLDWDAPAWQTVPTENTEISLREWATALHAGGISIDKIAKQIGCDWDTVRTAIGGDVANKRKPGPKPRQKAPRAAKPVAASPEPVRHTETPTAAPDGAADALAVMDAFLEAYGLRDKYDGFAVGMRYGKAA